VLALLLLAGAPAGAADVFGGYSSLRADGDQVKGGALALRWSLGSWRMVAEATGQQGLAAGDTLREVALTAGPVWSPWPSRRISPFAQVKAGGVMTRRQVEVFGVTIGKDGVCDGGCPSDTGVVAEAGAGLDVALGERLALRLPQVDYRWRSVGNERDLRLSAGVVLRLSGRR
jgi:hypothetical protein